MALSFIISDAHADAETLSHSSNLSERHKERPLSPHSSKHRSNISLWKEGIRHYDLGGKEQAV